MLDKVNALMGFSVQILHVFLKKLVIQYILTCFERLSQIRPRLAIIGAEGAGVKKFYVKFRCKYASTGEEE